MWGRMRPAPNNRRLQVAAGRQWPNQPIGLSWPAVGLGNPDQREIVKACVWLGRARRPC